jgi:hypothetical protein
MSNIKNPSSTNENKLNVCEFCKYSTSNIKDYNKHLNTKKHQKMIDKSSIEKSLCNNVIYQCKKCDKIYKDNSGLWRHKQKCKIINNNPEKIDVDLVLEVIKQSKELQNVLIEQTKELQNKLLEKENQLLEQNADHHKQIVELASKQTTSINSNNTTNQQFNLQFYLNETCKDAMNIVDFVNSLQLTTDDFETTGKLGFVDGISRIFIKELKKLDTEKLPIHCTDFKRETVYIKDNNIWEKENDEKKKLKWTIDKIAQLNLNQLQQWQEKYPECKENNTKANEHFFGLARVALGGFGKEEEDKFREKIMRNVLKEVVLDKKAGKSRLLTLPPT